MKTRTPVKTPPPKTPKPVKATKTDTPEATPLPGVTIRADVLSYTPTVHKPRIHIKTPTARYYKLVPGFTTTTKTEALAAAQAFQASILTSGVLPPPGVRKLAHPAPVEGD